MAARSVLLEHADERHSLRVNRFKHGLQVRRASRREVLLEHLLVLGVQLLVLLRVVLNLSLQSFDLLLKFQDVQLAHVALVLQRLVLLPQQPDRILKLLTVAVPVFEVFDIFESRQVECRDSHFDDVLLGTRVTHILVVQAEVHFHVALRDRCELVVRLRDT